MSDRAFDVIGNIIAATFALGSVYWMLALAYEKTSTVCTHDGYLIEVVVDDHFFNPDGYNAKRGEEWFYEYSTVTKKWYSVPKNHSKKEESTYKKGTVMKRYSLPFSELFPYKDK